MGRHRVPGVDTCRASTVLRCLLALVDQVPFRLKPGVSTAAGTSATPSSTEWSEGVAAQREPLQAVEV